MNKSQGAIDAPMNEHSHVHHWRQEAGELSKKAKRWKRILQEDWNQTFVRLIIPLSGILGSFRSQRARSGGHSPTKQSRPHGLGAAP